MGFTCKNHSNAKGITGKARDRLTEIELFVSSDRCLDLLYVKYWNKTDFSTLSVVEFIRSELKRKDASYSVVEYNNSFIKRLEEYGKIKIFEDLTYENIVGLDTVLRKTIDSEPTLYKRHSLFKGYIQEVINRGLFKGVNPYAFFKNTKGKSKDPIFLNESEYAKKLYLTQDESNLLKLKIVFSIFMIFEQLRKDADKRYDSFFASILEHSNVRFPKNVRIVSWNYDFQFEKAYSEYCSKVDIKDIQRSLFIKNKFFESAIDVTSDEFSITKLNGTTYFYDTENYKNYNLFLSINECENQFMQILDTYYPINIAEYKKNNLSSGLSFAWEHVKSPRTDQTIVDIVKQDTAETNILVVVGYSFPYFNRDIDREIIGNMKNLQKVYFQDLCPENKRERFMSIRNDIPIENLLLRKDTEQFLFPNEL